MRSKDAFLHQPLTSFVSSLEVRSEGVTKHQPSTAPMSILFDVGDNEVVKTSCRGRCILNRCGR